MIIGLNGRNSVLLFLTLFIITTGTIDAQSYSKNSIKLGWGIGASTADNHDGGGFVYTVGYQREIWKDRLRFNPNFSIGHYSSRFILDAKDQYFNPISMEANLYYDIVKVKSLSLVLGCGSFINNTRGLKGTGGDTDATTEPQHSEYIDELYYGGYIGGGFRVNKPNKRTAINIMPLNIRFGNNSFAEVHAKIEVDIKF